jgi:signal transduction histidine kinase
LAISLRKQLMISFMSVALLFVLFLILSFFLLDKGDTIRTQKSHIELLNKNIQLLILKDKDFLLYSSRDEAFYISEGLEYFQTRKSQFNELDSITLSLATNPIVKEFGVTREIRKLDSLLLAYEYGMSRMVESMRERGYKDEGLEGKMRTSAHYCEERLTGENKILLLQLRRNEKDYMLRREQAYIDKFNLNSIKLKDNLDKMPASTDSVKLALDRYRATFAEMVKIDQIIGNSIHEGLWAELRGLATLLEGTSGVIVEKAENYGSLTLRNLRYLWVFAVVIFLIGSVGMAFWLTQVISRPIKKIANSLPRKIESVQQLPPQINIETRIKEILYLQESFNAMLYELQGLIDDLEESRSNLNSQFEELQLINDKLKVSEVSLVETNKIKDKFFSIIAHDLRGPIGNLSAFLQMLVKHQDSFTRDEIKKFAHDMLASVSNLNTLLTNLLEWSRSQMNIIEPKPARVNIAEVAYRNIALFQDIIQQKELLVNVNADPDMFINTDQNMLDLIVRNLLSNAVKFSEKHGEVRLNAYKKDERIYFEVADKGLGMLPEELQLLFRQDTHFSKIGTMQEKGTGLGLLLCKEFIEILGGELNVDSVRFKGSVFRFYLPIQEAVKSNDSKLQQVKLEN